MPALSSRSSTPAQDPANHLRSSLQEGSAKGSGSQLRSKSLGQGGAKAGSAKPKEKGSGQATFLFSCTVENNGKMVKEQLERLGGRQSEPDEQPDIQWHELRCHVDFESLQGLVNHLLMLTIVWKTGMLRSVKERCRRTGKGFPPQWFPLTFRLPHESEQFRRAAQARSGRWICKPASENRGRGIFLVDGPTAAQPKAPASGGLKRQSTQDVQALASGSLKRQSTKDVQAAKDATSTESRATDKMMEKLGPVNGIVQKYIDSPLLGSDGRKFDLRMYLLVARANPLLVYFRGGYVRRCLVPYDQKAADLFAHLTNNSLQKKAKNYKEEADDTIWDLERWVTDLGLGVEWLESTMAPGMRKILLEVMLGCADEIRSSPQGTFTLLGVDFMYDSQLRPYILELNSNPALWTNTNVLRDVLPAVVGEALQLVMWAHGTPGSSSSEPQTKYSMVLDEGRGLSCADS